MNRLRRRFVDWQAADPTRHRRDLRQIMIIVGSQQAIDIGDPDSAPRGRRDLWPIPVDGQGIVVAAGMRVLLGARIAFVTRLGSDYRSRPQRASSGANSSLGFVVGVHRLPRAN